MPAINVPMNADEIEDQAALNQLLVDLVAQGWIGHLAYCIEDSGPDPYWHVDVHRVNPNITGEYQRITASLGDWIITTGTTITDVMTPSVYEAVYGSNGE